MHEAHTSDALHAARYTDGILQVVLPKRPRRALPQGRWQCECIQWGESGIDPESRRVLCRLGYSLGSSSGHRCADPARELCSAFAGSGRGDVYPGLGVCLSSFSVLSSFECGGGGGSGLQPKDLARLDAGGTRFSVAMMTTSGHAQAS